MLDFPLFIKPVAEGTGKGVDASSIVHDQAALRRGCQRLIETFHHGVLVEEFLPGREFTVGLIGTAERAEVLGTLEIVLRDTAEPERLFLYQQGTQRGAGRLPVGLG